MRRDGGIIFEMVGVVGIVSVNETIEQKDGRSSRSGGVVGQTGKFEILEEVDGFENAGIANESQGICEFDTRGMREIAEIEVLLNQDAKEAELLVTQ